jgi:predicted RNase H-like HicB family nuclease
VLDEARRAQFDPASIDAKMKQDQMTHRYTLVLERDPDGGYHVFCPALPGCHSQGDTVDEAITNGTEAVEAYLESLIAHHEPLPIEDIHSR